MKCDFFSPTFSQQINDLASLSQEELFDSLREDLQSEDPIAVLQKTLAYHLGNNRIIKKALKEDEITPALVRQLLPHLLSSPHYSKLCLLFLLFADEESEGDLLLELTTYPLDSQDLPLFTSVIYYLLKEGKAEAINLVLNLDEDFFSLPQRLQWLRNLLLSFSFFRPTAFPFPLDEAPLAYAITEKTPPFTVAHKTLGQPLVEAIFTLIKKVYCKNQITSLIEHLGELLWIGEKLNLSRPLVTPIIKWIKEIGFGEKLQDWLLLIERKKASPESLKKAVEECGNLPGQGLSLPLLLPLFSRFAGEPSMRKVFTDSLESIYPREDRIRAIAHLSSFRPPLLKEAWKILDDMEDPFRRSKALLNLLISSQKLKVEFSEEKFFSHLENCRPRDKEIFWKTFSLARLPSSFLVEHSDQIIESCQDLRNPLRRLTVFFLLAEKLSLPSSKNPFLEKGIKLIEELPGEDRVEGLLWQAVWNLRDRQQASSAYETLVDKIENLPIVPRRQALLEKLLSLAPGSPIFTPLCQRLVFYYLKGSLSPSPWNYSQVVSTLGLKSVIAKSWISADPLFDRAFEISQRETDEYGGRCQFAIVSDLADIAESTGLDEPWAKGLKLALKAESDNVKRKCLIRLLRLPSYAVSIEGKKFTRVIKAIAKLRDDVERKKAFLLAGDIILDKGHLISDKSSLFSRLKRVARSFRSPFHLSQTMGKLALICLSWDRDRDANEFFAVALENALVCRNEYQKFQALDALAPYLCQAQNLEDKGGFIHDMMEATDKMMDYRAEIYGIIAFILQNWDRKERARSALEKAILLTEPISDEIRMASALQYISELIEANPALNHKDLLERLFYLVPRVQTPLCTSQTLSYLGGAFLSASERKRGVEAFECAIEKVGAISPPINQIQAIETVLDKLLDGGAYEMEEELFHKIWRTSQDLPYPLYRDRISTKIVEVALQSSLPDFAEMVLATIENRFERNRARALAAQNFQYRNPDRALKYVDSLDLPQLRHEILQKLVRNLSLYQNPQRAQKIFKMAISHRQTTDVVLATYLKSMGSAAKMITIL